MTAFKPIKKANISDETCAQLTAIVREQLELLDKEVREQNPDDPRGLSYTQTTMSKIVESLAREKLASRIAETSLPQSFRTCDLAQKIRTVHAAFAAPDVTLQHVLEIFRRLPWLFAHTETHLTQVIHGIKETFQAHGLGTKDVFNFIDSTPRILGSLKAPRHIQTTAGLLVSGDLPGPDGIWGKIALNNAFKITTSHYYYVHLCNRSESHIHAVALYTILTGESIGSAFKKPGRIHRTHDELIAEICNRIPPHIDGPNGERIMRLAEKANIDWQKRLQKPTLSAEEKAKRATTLRDAWVKTQAGKAQTTAGLARPDAAAASGRPDNPQNG